MKKFNIIYPEYAFYLYKKSHDWLFEIGYSEIVICKKGSVNLHYCEQRSFNYEGNQKTLCGKEDSWNPFELKQFTVIQMK